MSRDCADHRCIRSLLRLLPERLGHALAAHQRDNLIARKHAAPLSPRFVLTCHFRDALWILRDLKGSEILRVDYDYKALRAGHGED